MQKRRRFKQSISLKDRLALFSKGARERASDLPSSRERDELLEKARRADTASQIDDWAGGPDRGSRPDPYPGLALSSGRPDRP
jgi:hypothetical protein